MVQSTEVIPFCLYSNETNSYIGLPYKHIENGVETFSCEAHEDMKFVTMFYGLNPDIVPHATYSDDLCVAIQNKRIVDISTIYDPFNVDINCLRFMGWLEPTPCAYPLYVWKNGNNILITMTGDAPANYVAHSIPKFYVLMDPREALGRPDNCIGDFPIKDNLPVFTFADSYGKCIPDPTSRLRLGECMVLHNKNIITPEKIGYDFDIIRYLEDKYKAKIQRKKGYWWILIVIAVLLVCVAFVFLVRYLKNIDKK